MPTWVTFNPAYRTFSGTPSSSEFVTIPLAVTADDGNGGTETDTFDITVLNTNDAPTVANPIPDQFATENSAFNFQFGLNVFNDIDVGDELSYTAQLAGGGSLPTWLSFDGLNRRFTGTPAQADVGDLEIDVIASDGKGGSITDTFKITVVNVNDAPTVQNSIPNQNATEDVEFVFQFDSDVFFDADGDELSYSVQLAGGGTLPTWLTFNPANRTFSGTPTNSEVGTITIAVTADDGNGGTETDTFDITVLNTNDAPTVANPIPDQFATENSAFNFQFGLNVFNDIDVGDELSYTAQLAGGGSLPTWLSFDGTTRTFSGTPGNSDVGNLDVVVTASDSDGASVSDTFTLIVVGVNDAPVITAPFFIQVTEDVLSPLTGISIEDVDAGSGEMTLTLSVTSGALSATSGGGVTVGGTTTALTLSGSLSDLNDFISAGHVGFTTALNQTDQVEMELEVNDNGNTGTGGALTNRSTVFLLVLSVNDPPVNIVPGPQSVDQGGILIFSTANGNAISTSDVETRLNDDITVTLTAINGTLTSISVIGVTTSPGDGIDDSSITLSGTVTNVNNAMNGLEFRPTPGYFGNASLTITSNDGGKFGLGGVLTDTDEISITVNSINPIVNRVTSSVADGFYKIGDVLTIEVEFDQVVEVNTTGGSPTLSLETGATDRQAVYLEGSGTNTLSFSYTVQQGDFSSDLDYSGIDALALNGGIIENVSNDPAVLDLPAAGTANSLSGQKDIGIDGVVPVITSVSVPSNGVYAIGQNLDFTINLSEAVLVNGTPQLSLTIGTNTAQASYLSGSGSNVLVFRYTVQSGDLDLNGIVVGSLSLNDGTIRDAAGNNANLTINTVGSTSQVLVDGVAPTVVSLSLNDNSFAIGQTATLTLILSERISGLQATDFTVGNGILSGLSSSDGGETWTASFTPSLGIEDDTNVISLNNAGYTDLAGNAGNGTTESFNYEIDTRRPTATIVVAEAELNSGKTSLVTITFTEAVTGLMLDDFSVANGILSDLESVNGGITWTATLTPDSGVEDASNLIILDNTGYQDLAGNTGSGITESNNYSVDTQIPAGYSVSIVPDRINGVNQNNFSFSLIDGELGSDYSFSISSSAGGTPVTGTGDVTSQNQLIDGVNVSSLPDGILTLTVTLTDASGNEGGEVSDTVEKRLPAVLTITVRTQAGENNATDGEFEILTDNLFATNTTVTIQVGGTASPGSDYQALGTSFVFPGNTPSVILPVSIIDDFNVEGEETIILTLTGTDNDLVTIGTPSEATMTISDDDVATELIITPTAGQNKEYGDTDPDAYAYTVEGFKNGDNISILTGALSREVGEDAGTYAYTLGNLNAGPNYELVLNPEVFTITPATLSIQVDELEKVYGDDNPVYTYTPTGFKLNDTASILGGALGRTGGENVGTYGYNLGTLTAGANYNLQLISTTPFLITPAPLRIIADDKQKIYGEANPPLTFTYDGLVNGDTQLAVEPTLSTEATISSPVGTYDITVTGGSDPNYSILRVEGTLTIGQKTVTITASNQSKVYGEANPVLTFSYNGLLDGDTQIQIEPTISTEATISSPVGTYDITLTGGSDPNYDFTLVNGTLSITPATLTIIADDKSRVYGAVNPPLTFSYAGLVNGDTGVAVEPSLATTATSSSNVGTYPITLTGGSDPNYAITRVNGTLSVTPAPLTITVDNKQKIYGEANPPLTFTYEGLVNGDTQIQTEPTLETTATQISPVGNYPITLTGGSDPNYSISRVNGILTIGQKTVTITAANQSKVYGQANPPLTFSYVGLLEGDTQIQIEPTISTEATISSPVGTYDITLTGGSDPNYAFNLVNGTLSITPASLTITADDQQKIYGEANPVLTFSYTGLVNGDTKVTTEPSISTTATASSNVGTYPITLIGGSDQNYAITLVNGTLIVGQKALTITADDKSKVYGEANPVLTISYNGLVNGDTQVTTLPSISTTATQGSNVGTYPITLSGGSDQNYAITLVNGTLTIGQKALTITADDKSKVYGESNPTLTFTYTGLVNGDTQVTTEPSISTTATQGSNVGTYPITLSGGSDPNYAITLVNGTLTVGQKAVTITADDKQKIYGEANPVLTFSYTGLVNGDTKVTTEPSISTTATQGSNVGTYPITLSGGSDLNYAITLVNGTLTVGQKALTITADDKSKVYGEANPVLTFSYTGLVNGDTKVTTEPSISTTATQAQMWALIQLP
nr:MBG domain-containing protein [Algoriphagus sp. AK58]